MHIVLGFRDEDIAAVRKLRNVSELKCEFFCKKEDSEEGLTEQESAEYMDWLRMGDLLGRMECVIRNQQIICDGGMRMCAPDFESMECKETVRPCTSVMPEGSSFYDCPVEGNLLRLRGMVFRNKKLLPYDGCRVKVLEHCGHISVFTAEGGHIVDLYKRPFVFAADKAF